MSRHDVRRRLDDLRARQAQIALDAEKGTPMCPSLNDAQAERDRRGITACAACGHEPTAADPLLVIDGYRIHQSHTTDPQSGFYGAEAH